MQADGTKALAQVRTVLSRNFGYSGLRPFQEAVIRDVLQGRDVVVVHATGGGKSLCFQIPPLIADGSALVISPLVSLMEDQVQGLRQKGIPAAALSGYLSPVRVRDALRRLRDGEVRFLYVAPERAVLPSFLSALQQVPLSLIAIDEAHCISQWGHQFRPEYRELAVIREYLPKVPMIALTATATPQVRADIAESLRMKEPAVHVGSFSRPNLVYEVRTRESFQRDLVTFIREAKGPGIVYCPTRNETVEIAAFLTSRGIPARPYHAGIGEQERGETQALFIRGSVPVICATVAFGMGVHKPDIRFIVHTRMPKDPESYYQETGRGGRDGGPCHCLLFCGPQDRKILSYLVRKDEHDPVRREVLIGKVRAMARYTEGLSCRRTTLLRYFGEEPEDPWCGLCDVCTGKAGGGADPPDISQVPGYKGREAVDPVRGGHPALAFRAVREICGGVGLPVSTVAKVLAGRRSEAVCRLGLDNAASFGAGSPYGREYWSALIRDLASSNLFRRGENGRITGVAGDIATGPLDLGCPGPSGTGDRRIIPGMRDGPRVREGESRLLAAQLRGVRAAYAREMHFPPFVVFPDATLERLVAMRPKTPDALRKVKGMGPWRISVCGEACLALIQAYEDQRPAMAICPPTPLGIGAGYPEGNRGVRSDPIRGVCPGLPISATLVETFFLAGEGKDLTEIAAIRGLRTATIAGHITRLIEAGQLTSIDRWVSPERQEAIYRVMDTIGDASLSAVRDRLGEEVPWEELTLARAYRKVAGPLPAPLPVFVHERIAV